MIMIKSAVLTATLSIVGCVSGTDTFNITCPGTNVPMSVCFNKALNKCPQGWKRVGNVPGGERGLKIKCD